jgi:hypothetical protein
MCVVVQPNISLYYLYHFFVLSTFSTFIYSFVAVFVADSELLFQLMKHTDVLTNLKLVEIQKLKAGTQIGLVIQLREMGILVSIHSYAHEVEDGPCILPGK